MVEIDQAIYALVPTSSLSILFFLRLLDMRIECTLTLASLPFRRRLTHITAFILASLFLRTSFIFFHRPIISLTSFLHTLLLLALQMAILKQLLPAPIQNLRIVAIKANSVGFLHAIHANRPPLAEIKHRLGVDPLLSPIRRPITLNLHARFPQIRKRRLPRLVDILPIQPRQLGDVSPDKRTLLVPFLPKRHGAVAPVELRKERRAAQPLPVPRIARRLVVEEQLLEHFGAALPRDVAPAASEEAGDGVPPQMVDPAFLAQLPHQGVDPGEAGEAGFPALEPRLGFAAVDVVSTRRTLGVGRYGGLEMPGYEAAVCVVFGLAEGIAERCLGAEIHVSEEQLAGKGYGRLGGFPGVGGDDVLHCVVELPDGQRAEV